MRPKSTLKGEYGSGKDPSSRIPLAFPSLIARFVNLTELIPYGFWEHLKIGKA